MLKVLITGGSGFIGRNLVELLGNRYRISAPSSAELDLLDEAAVRDYLCARHFDAVIHAATTRANRRLGASSDLLDRNCRMFFNLARNEALFGKMICFGSGAGYDRRQLPAQVPENYFDTRVPADPYGFSKYICAKYTERSERLTELRLFGVFGRYESWDVRFISNACCRMVKSLPILIRRDVHFDYIHVEDVANITDWFLKNDSRWRAYNVCRKDTHTLTELARIVSDVSGRAPAIVLENEGFAPEYSGDNSRLLAEIGGYRFREMRDAIADLYAWYAAREALIDETQLRFDG